MQNYFSENKHFIAYLIASACMSLVSISLTVAIGWHIYELTKNPFDLALVGLMEFTPMLCLFIVTGLVIDKFSRKAILIICAVTELIMCLLLAVVMNAEVIDKYLIFACLILHGTARAFYMPAMQAVLPNIVSKAFFTKAVAISSTVWNVAFTAGPFAAGVMIAWLNLSLYWVLVAIAAVAVVLYLFLPYMAPQKAQGRAISELVGGINFVRKNPYVLGSISLDLMIVLTGSVMTLMPVYALDILNVGPEMLGLLRAMPALGAIMVGVAMSNLPPLRHSGKCLFASLLAFALSVLIFALSENLWLSVFALWLYGATDMVSVNIRTTLLQIATPDSLRGRVSAVNSLFIITSNKMGDFRAGAVASILSPVATVTLGGVMALGVVVLGYFWFPEIRKVDRMEASEIEK